MLKPQKGEWEMKAKGISGDQINISLVYNYDLELVSSTNVFYNKGQQFIDAAKKYDIDVVSTLMGQDVVDKIDSGDNFDLILIKDEIKPDSAYTIFNKLKADKKFNIPVVIMINKDKEFIKKHFADDGYSDCIVYDNLENDLKNVCEKYI